MGESPSGGHQCHREKYRLKEFIVIEGRALIGDSLMKMAFEGCPDRNEGASM